MLRQSGVAELFFFYTGGILRANYIKRGFARMLDTLLSLPSIGSTPSGLVSPESKNLFFPPTIKEQTFVSWAREKTIDFGSKIGRGLSSARPGPLSNHGSIFLYCFCSSLALKFFSLFVGRNQRKFSAHSQQLLLYLR